MCNSGGCLASRSNAGPRSLAQQGTCRASRLVSVCSSLTLQLACSASSCPRSSGLATYTRTCEGEG